jgi:pectinesterase
MLTLKDFEHAESYSAKDFIEALRICEDLRKKDAQKPYIILLEEGCSKGNFIFPYSHFLLRSKKGQHELSGSLYAKMKDDNGEELSTWKTATLKVTGSHNLFIGFTIENTAGDPANKGQEVALALYGDDNLFYDCTFRSTQDTLFVGPLPDDLSTRYIGFIPENERYHEGNTTNYLLTCAISGSVDFIFGAGKADFYQCKIGSVDDGREVSYVSAPAHSLKDDFGFFFDQCAFVSEGAKENSVYLARPWRDYGKSVFASCTYESHIKGEGFAEWNDEKRYRTARFEEYPLQNLRVSWVKNNKSAPLPERYVLEDQLLETALQRLK